MVKVDAPSQRYMSMTLGAMMRKCDRGGLICHKKMSSVPVDPRGNIDLKGSALDQSTR